MSIKMCSICEYGDAKYKCVKCKQFYCSVACSKKHKDICTGNKECKNDNVKEKSKEKPSKQYEVPTEDIIPKEKLEGLRFNNDLEVCMKNLEVREIMERILSDENPMEAISRAMMTEPAFVELATTCINFVEPSDEENKR